MQRKKQKDEGEKKTKEPVLPKRELYGDGLRWLDRKCPECHKSFCVPDAEIWVYKDGYTLLCSWHCMRSREKKRSANVQENKDKKPGKQRLKPEVRAEMIRMIKEGMKPTEIDEKLGVSRHLVWHYQQMLRKKKQI